jgi:hypothetical protein
VPLLSRLTPAGRSFRLLACIVAVLGLAFGCQGRNFYVQLASAHRLAAELRLQFNQANDASNRAVMADTDEASTAFAADAEKALKIVESDAAELMPVLNTLGFPNEIKSLEEFAKHFAEYRELDHTILGLAVENTNLKAQRLSFGPAREAADNFRDALSAVASRIPAKERCGAEELITKATLAVREIQVLQAPHIAEPDDATMTKLEQQMDQLGTTAKGSVTALAELVPKGTRPALTAARSALDRFQDTSRQIVALSRRNSNVRSFDLSLRTKPALTSACDNSLRSLEEQLDQEDIKATR